MEQKEFKLTRNQLTIFNTVERTFDNYLIHGKPGVGKSVLIRHLIAHGNKHFTIAAPTGLAALNIDGRTLHSIFRIPVSQGIIHPTFNKFNLDDKVVNAIKYGIKALIIDEISMVRADILDFIDRYMRFCKEQPDKPFGGVQVIAVGDFFQLPPVTSSQEKAEFVAAGYDSPFAFDAKVFAGNFHVVFLNQVLRQKGDKAFIDLLDTVRMGAPMYSQLKLLNARVGQHDGMCITVASTNQQADIVNQKRLNELDAESSAWFVADKFGEWPAMPCDERMELRVGAQVLVKKNGADRPQGVRDHESKVVNGTLGKVLRIVTDENLLDRGENLGSTDETQAFVEIELENKDVVKIYRQRWERKVKKLEDGEWDEKLVASFEQMPLILAWAISIHKSQGQSFNKVHIDASRIFAAGQLYVACSRARTLKGITFEDKLNPNKFWADKDVLRFFKQFED